MITKENKKVLVLGYYSSLDFGNLAMINGFIEKYKGYELYLATFYPSIERVILKDVNIINILHLQQIFKLLKESISIHLIFGDSLTGRYGLFSKLFVLYSLILANIFPKKCVIEASTIFPSKFSLSLLRILLARIKEIKVREKKFLHTIKILNKNSRLSIDLSAIYLKSFKNKRFKKRNKIVFVIRNISNKLMSIKRDEFVKILATQIIKIIEKNKKIKIIFLPFQYGVRKKVDDRKILNEIYNYLPSKIRKKIILVNELLTLEKVIKIIGESKAVVSFRLHPCIFAYFLGTKFIAIKEQEKIEEFAKNRGFLLSFKQIECLNELLEKIINQN
jgi:polysaccharide pyruvyl transferase WcaK-like protein